LGCRDRGIPTERRLGCRDRGIPVENPTALFRDTHLLWKDTLCWQANMFYWQYTRVYDTGEQSHE
jgi:hypothetical protein